MTDNKRFKQNGNEILLNNEVWAMAYAEHSADVITTALNELIDKDQAIQRKVWKLIDWLETEKGVSREEIKEWWND